MWPQGCQSFLIQRDTRALASDHSPPKAPKRLMMRAKKAHITPLHFLCCTVSCSWLEKKLNSCFLVIAYRKKIRMAEFLFFFKPIYLFRADIMICNNVISFFNFQNSRTTNSNAEEILDDKKSQVTCKKSNCLHRSFCCSHRILTRLRNFISLKCLTETAKINTLR